VTEVETPAVTAELPRPVRLIRHAWIPMPDGCRLAARIWLPEDAERDPVPAVVEYIPYRKNDATALRDAPIHGYFAAHGYASVRVDLRGSGDSDGILEDEYLPLEQADGLEVLRWLAAQPWCTGKAGIIGKSWGGFNGLQIAAHRPPELAAVISVASTDDRYADDVHYIGGCVQALDMLAWGATMLAYNARPPDPSVAGPGWRRQWLDRLETTPHVERWLEHQRRDDYWRQGSVCEDFGALRCAVYMVGGWSDGYRSAVLRFLAGYPGPCKGLIGPWGHVYPHDGVPGPAIGFLQEAVRWWDYWLKGVDNGIMAEPKLRMYAQRAVRPQPFVPVREGRWIAERGWPSPNVSAQTLFLAAPGGLAAEPGAGEPLQIRGTECVVADPGPWCGWGGPLDYPADQGGDDGRSLTFTSAPLTATAEILGCARVRLRLSADVPQALVAVRLCDVWPDRASTLISRGVLNLAHRDGHHAPRPLSPGEPCDVTITMNAISYDVPAGHRLRVAISPAYWPIVWPSPEPATLTVTAGPRSWLELPVRRPGVADPPPPAHFDAPQAAPPPDHLMLGEASGEERTWHRDARRGRTRMVAEAAHFPHVRLTASGLEYCERGQDAYEISDGDPLSARVVCERQISISRAGWVTRVETRSTLTATRERFHLTNAVDAYEGETRLAARTWTRSIPRDQG
jgi:putative CocE/NonD family hydrolase